MKRSHGLRLSLGLKQWEMAALLGISRAQLGMYESGKRNLPAAASRKHAELEMMCLQLAAKRSNAPEPDRDHSALIHKMLHENHYRQINTERKIEVLRRKIQPFIMRREVNDLLLRNMGDTDGKSPAKRIMPQENIEACSDALFQLEIKLEVLQAEEKILKSKLIVNGEVDG